MSIQENEQFPCPWCGATNAIEIDLSAGSKQQFTTDCETCCKPMVISFKVVSSGEVEDFEVRQEGGGPQI